MRLGVLRSAWINVRTRLSSTSMMWLVLILLGAGTMAVAVPVFSVRDAVRQHYLQDSWTTTYAVSGIRGSDAPMTSAQGRDLSALSGVRSVTPDVPAAVPIADTQYTFHSAVRAHAHAIVEGRLPADECEIAVSRDSSLAGALGERVAMTSGSKTSQATIVGLIARGYPLLSSSDIIGTCPVTDGENSWLVDSQSPLPEQYVAESIARILDRNLASQASTGILPLLLLGLSVISLGVVTATVLWSVKSRRTEFATARIFGASSGQLLAMLLVEAALVSLAAAPLSYMLGWAGAHFLVGSGGNNSLIDPSWLWSGTRPSLTVAAATIGGFWTTMSLTSLAAGAPIVRQSIASLIRRAGE